MPVDDIADSLVIREQDTFLLTNAKGQVPAANDNGYGLYHRDTRHLSRYELLLDGAEPIVLQSSAGSGFSQEQVLGNHRSEQGGRTIGRCTVELRRQRILGECLHERLVIVNYNPFPLTVRLTYHFDADFADLFEVRGFECEGRGVRTNVEVDERQVTYRYWGLDGIWRRTSVVFEQPPDVLKANEVGFVLDLSPRESRQISLRVVVAETEERRDYDAELGRLRVEYDRWRDAFVQVHTDNETFNEVLNRDLTDLRMLWTTDRQGRSFIAAGTPWFATLFGRDSLITSLQILPFQPGIVRQCLALLARFQGQAVDRSRDEEPGKIVHEIREDELSNIGELPFGRYYGSVDSTPLFLLLAGEYFRWTADRGFIEFLRPSIEAGLRWLSDYADRNGDGFIEYATDSQRGLRNQGWKDSRDAIVHTNGTICEGPIAVAEVQGYVYAAYRGLADCFEAIGEPDRARDLRAKALHLRRQFNSRFWLPHLQRVAMALDGEGRPSEVMSSNSGQVLFSGILNKDRAKLVRDALFRNDMFSGWGIRTLSSDASSYYPQGYHLGTVWPHDNALIAQGLKLYGFSDEVNELATALFDAALEFPAYRLPELFGGHPRAEFQPPVPYPVACRPQAWAAGVFLHLLQAILGLVPDAAHGRLHVVRPKLPYWLREVHVSGLRVGSGEVDLHVVQRRGRTHTTFESRGLLVIKNSRRD